jgi:hypothetical protein
MPDNLRDILSRHLVVTPFQALQAEAFLHNMKAIDLERNPPEPSASALVGAQLARSSKVVPVRLANESSGSRLIIAIADPNDLSGVEAVRRKTRIDIQPVLAAPDQIASVLNRLYPAAV